MNHSIDTMDWLNTMEDTAMNIIQNQNLMMIIGDNNNTYNTNCTLKNKLLTIIYLLQVHIKKLKK